MKLDELTARFTAHDLEIVLDTDRLKVFDFKNKNRSIHNYQRWVIDRGTLIVTGDNYASVYRWNDTGITLKFLAECNLDYFSSKCIADKDGDTQKTFDSEYAETMLKQIAVDHVCANLSQRTENIIPDDFGAWPLNKKIEHLKLPILQETGGMKIKCTQKLTDLYEDEILTICRNY